MNKKITVFIILLLLLGIGAGYYWWKFERGYEYTDDAYVEADIAKVSARIYGNIQKIMVDNDDYVKKGDLLLTLDPSDLLAQRKILVQAKNKVLAEIKASQIQLQMTDVSTLSAIEAAKSKLEQAKLARSKSLNQLKALKNKRQELNIALTQAQRDLKRYQKLWQKKLISDQSLEKLQDQVKTLQNKLQGLNEQILAARKTTVQAQEQIKAAQAFLNQHQALRKQIEMLKAKIAGLKAGLKEVEAKIDQLDLNLSYTKVKAPISGYVAQKKVQIGERVMPGELLLAIVPLDKVYVEANFKETQLTNMYIGQKAIIKPDIYPNLTLEGKIVGIRAGTGSVFSLLPPENAVGNWIKVVQRVPVKIVFTSKIPKNYPLRVGLSLEVKVDTRTKTGPRLRPYAGHTK